MIEYHEESEIKKLLMYGILTISREGFVKIMSCFIAD